MFDFYGWVVVALPIVLVFTLMIALAMLWKHGASAREHDRIAVVESSAKGESNHPFAGYSNESGAGAHDLAPANAHLLVSGPTGSGKSRRVLAPAALMHDGPVVMVSSKPDLLDLVAQGRIDAGGHGRTYLLDFSGAVQDSSLPDGMEKVYLDPCMLIASDDKATDIALMLIGKPSSRDPFWDLASSTILAGVLRAAGTDGVKWALAAMSTFHYAPMHPVEAVKAKAAAGEFGNPHDPDEFDEDAYLVELAAAESRSDLSLWSAAGTDALPEFDCSEPNWFNAAARLQLLGSTGLAQQLRAGLFSPADKMIGSYANICLNAMRAWVRESTMPPEGARLVDYELLTHPRATLFIVSPAGGAASSAAVATLDALASRWRDNQSEDVRLDELLFVIDELTNTAVWPNLPVVVSEARSMGLRVVAALQSTTQLARAYDSMTMEELRRIFPSVLLLSGSSETELMGMLRNRVSMLRSHNGLDLDLPRVPTSRDEGLLFHSAPPTNEDGRGPLDMRGEFVRLDDVSRLTRTVGLRLKTSDHDFRRESDTVPDLQAEIRRRLRVVELLATR